MEETLRKAALEYHEHGRPGKISVTPTKQLSNQRDLALAYSPGVAAACDEIVSDPMNAFRFTGRGNLVGVIPNGTEVRGRIGRAACWGRACRYVWVAMVAVTLRKHT